MVKQQKILLRKGRAVKVRLCTVGKTTDRCQWRKSKYSTGLLTLGMVHHSIQKSMQPFSLGILGLQVQFDFSFNFTHHLALPQGFGQCDLPET